MKYLVTFFASLALVACGQQQTSTTETTPSAQIAEISGDVIMTGTFEGRSEHVTSGKVTIRKDDEGYLVVLESDFSLDGAPDPVLGFGNPDYLPETKFAALKNKTGQQTYRLSADTNLSAFETIYVWCGEFSVPLGVATLS